ncbi:transcription factor HES-7.1-like [Clupea harengus]|uniref:Transcription factor HES-7.1-like n=1 Tax=Clupea harengus TaxID=7950 RepID=A0A6P8GW54_CLUHA|nr:transcription factor HES-7.1-like [Clupea harengus]
MAKPLMEKRRRDRINHSLETLRLLLSENTNNEKLRSPKVEKAEILESVVNFLRAEQPELQTRTKGRKRAREEDTEDPAHSPMYSDGMRTCLLTVSHFIASKSQELEGGLELEWKHSYEHLAQKPPATTAMAPHDSSSLSTKQLSMPGSPATGLSASTAQSGPQETKATYMATKNTSASPKPSSVLSDGVWRPWPQESRKH